MPVRSVRDHAVYDRARIPLARSHSDGTGKVFETEEEEFAEYIEMMVMGDPKKASQDEPGGELTAKLTLRHFLAHVRVERGAGTWSSGSRPGNAN